MLEPSQCRGRAEPKTVVKLPNVCGGQRARRPAEPPRDGKDRMLRRSQDCPKSLFTGEPSAAVRVDAASGGSFGPSRRVSWVEERTFAGHDARRAAVSMYGY